MKRIIVLISLVALFVTACVEPQTIEVSSVTLSPDKLELVEGETVKLTVTVLPEDASDKSVAWTTSNSSVATVDNGTVTAVSAGSAVIMASTSNGKVAACTVVVNEPPVPAESVSLDRSSLELTVGETARLTATVLPEDATDKTVTWTTNNDNVATVDNGTVTAVSAGSAVIMVTTSNGKVSVCTVVVNEPPIPAESVSLDRSTLEITEGETARLVATVLPEDATDKTEYWTTNNDNVAIVDNGTVTAVSAGSAVIMVTTSNGKVASCTVIVKKPTIPVQGVFLDRPSLELTEGETARLMATVFPENATDKTVTWTTNNEDVARVDNGTVTAVAAGTAVIVASTSNGKVASCTVIVKKPTIPVQGVFLDKASLELTEGETARLTATVLPEDATDRSVTWTTNNASVAIVENGTVTALAAGTAVIMASTSNDKVASCTVVVKKPTIPVQSVFLDRASLELTEGETARLTATVLPEDATDKTVTWTTNNGSVAIVENGIVTAVAAGSAVIMASSSNGKVASCTVSVKNPIIPVQGVFLDSTSLELTEGETTQLTATVFPQNATDKTVAWTSSNESVATVSSFGVIIAVAPGTAVITATTSDGERSASCIVTVKKPTIHVTSVSLNKTNLTLEAGTTETLTATVLPMNATDKKVTWDSSNESVATVSSSGVVEAVKVGVSTITVKTHDGRFTATCEVVVSKPTTGKINGYDWVDLGLKSGLKWATCNVGADAPAAFGVYFSWGETVRNSHCWSSYKWCNASRYTLTKYCTSSSYGNVDNNTVLDLEDDAAHVNWGGTWRMPTKAEWDELIDECTWTWTTDGSRGMLVIGPNGNSIFLPTTGGWFYVDYLEESYHLFFDIEGNYWSSSLSAGSPDYAYGVCFDSDGVRKLSLCRSEGFSVRPVSE